MAKTRVVLKLQFPLCFFLLLIAPAVFAESDARAVSAAAELAASLNDSDLAAQVLITGIDGRQRPVPAMRALLERMPAGGIMFFRYNLDTSAGEVKALISETGRISAGRTGILPFMAVDHEGGYVHRFGAVAERLPSAFYFWELAQKAGQAPALAQAGIMYTRSAREIGELGINMVLGPVAEILDRENEIFLETRSYGPSADFVQAAASVYIKSMDSAGIVSVVKHFPGNTSTDPHTGISVLRAEKPALDEMVKPFAGIISGLNVPAIMLSHVMVPAVDGRRNASLSRVIIENWLRGELGFNGIVIADDFSMGAVTDSGLSHEAAAVEALNAGVDMIMVWPRNLAPVHASILRALNNGALSRDRLLEAAQRIIREKIRYGIINIPE